MIHSLKTEAKYFEDVISDNKPFEVRENDRDFMVGDFLALNELKEDAMNGYTGRCCLAKITYVLTDKRLSRKDMLYLGLGRAA